MKISLFAMLVSCSALAQNTFYTDCGKHFNVKTGILSLYGDAGPAISLHSESRFTDHFWGDMGIGYSTKSHPLSEAKWMHRGYFSYTLFFAPVYSNSWRVSYGAGVSTLVNLMESTSDDSTEGYRYEAIGGIIPQIHQSADITYQWALRWGLQLSSTLFIDRNKDTSYALEGGISYSF